MNETITSASNPTVKRLRKLITSSKARREANNFVAEGIHLTRSFLVTKQVPLLCICAESALKNPEVTELLLVLDDMPIECTVIADSLFESITSIHAQVGIVIVFSPIAPSLVGAIETSAVILEDIQDPGNLGTILRTAAAVGMKDIVLSSGCASPWSPKALRAGMGAQFSLSLHEDVDLPEIIKTATIPTLATVVQTNSQSLYDLDLSQPVAWIFGSEGTGVSDSLARLASVHVTIPQASSSIESLNVSAAAAVCLYEQYRQKILQ